MTDEAFFNLPFFDAEHAVVRQRIADWIANEPGIDDHDEGNVDRQSRAFVESLGRAGIIEYLVPSYSAGSLSKVDVRSICIVREALAYRSALADSAIVVQGIAAAPLWQFGSDRLQRQYLDDVRAGRAVPAFALSEPTSGSDVAATRTTATRAGDEYIINGSKMWTSNAGIADFYIVVARTGEAPGAKGLSAFVVDADTPGFSVGEPIVTASPHPMASTRYDNVRVPEWKMVGRPGEGFAIAMATLDIFRSSVGAASLGLARRAMDETLARITSRKLFGRLMADMETVQMKLADMAVDLDLAALATYRGAWVRDHAQGKRTTREASIAKLVGSEAAYRVVDEAVQLFGGMGVTRGCIIEQLFRDVRAMRIYEGASEVQRSVIGKLVAKGAIERHGVQRD